MVLSNRHDETPLLLTDQNQRARAGGALAQSPCASARRAGGGVCAPGGVQRIGPRRIVCTVCALIAVAVVRELVRVEAVLPMI